MFLWMEILVVWLMENYGHNGYYKVLWWQSCKFPWCWWYSNSRKSSKGIQTVLEDPEAKVVLVNIFGGIVRCDLIAEGILAAMWRGWEIPVVVRLEGNSADIGSKIYQNLVSNWKKWFGRCS